MGEEAGTYGAQLERIAIALEKAVELDQPQEIQGNPPVCPHCGKFNPRVYVLPDEGGSGPMTEIIFKGRCMECDTEFYACYESYSCHTTKESLSEEMEEKRKAGWFDG